MARVGPKRRRGEKNICGVFINVVSISEGTVMSSSIVEE